MREPLAEQLFELGAVEQEYFISMEYLRGKDLLLVQTNVGIIIPVLMSSRRYGVMWDTYSQMRFKDDASGASMWAESAPGGVDYYFLAGDTPDAVVADTALRQPVHRTG